MQPVCAKALPVTRNTAADPEDLPYPDTFKSLEMMNFFAPDRSQISPVG
jgi:hypothetical protein